MLVTMRYRAIAFLAAATAFGQFPSPTLTEVTTKVSDHIFMTAGFPNVVYVVGNDATLVVDTGLGNNNGALVARTANDEWILVGPGRAVITGDIVQNTVVPSVASSGGSFSSWLTVLDKLVPLQPRIVIPTHSKVGDASLITSEAAFIRDMQSRAAALKRSGVSAAEAAARLTEVFKTNYPDWAANTDWPNLNSMTGFINRLYTEIP